jgi:hypoxanthine phosphoribosyltransferase
VSERREAGTPPSSERGPSAPAPLLPETLLDEAEIRKCVDRLAGEISADHPDGVVLVGVLKGASIFLADLARAIRTIDVEVDFIAISRYAPDSGRVRIVQDVTLELHGRDVVLVEDLVDTGLTLGYLVEHVRRQAPRRVEVCALLDRPARRILPMAVRYVGREIPDVFVLGYGLHRADLYRNVPRVVVADREVVGARPDAYVPALYGTAGSDRRGRC